MIYLHKINEEDYPSPTCPLCNSNDHDTGHLFNCTEIPTDLTTESLGTDPVGAAALLEVWGRGWAGPELRRVRTPAELSLGVG